MYLAIDIGIGVILLVSAIVGIIRGFHKQFTKGVCSFVAFFAAIAVTALLLPPIRGLDFYQGFQNTTTGWFSADFFTTRVNSAEELRVTLENSALSILSGIADQTFESMQIAQVDTLGRFFGNAIVNVVAAFIVWLAFYLIIKFALFGLRALLTKAATLPVLKSIDKIFGFIWAEALTYLVVVSLLLTVIEIVVVQFLGDWVDPLKDIVANSKLLNVAHNINVIGSAIAKVFGVDLTALTTVA